MSKYKIDLNVPVKNIMGEDLPDRLGRQLANAIVSQTQGDALKLYFWAVELAKGNVIEIDQSDFDALKSVVKESQFMTILGKGQILGIINDLKPE